jgi:hypothetical protein
LYGLFIQRPRRENPGMDLVIINRLSSWRIEKEMGNLRRIVLDVLKPLEPNIVDLVQKISTLDGVDGVNITIYEIDHHVENAKITVEGEQLIYRELHDLIVETGGAVHSIDEVAAGKRTVEEVVTHQD